MNSSLRLNGYNYQLLLINVIDHYYTSLYIFLTPVLGKIFLKDLDNKAGVGIFLLTISTPLISKLIGSTIIGYLADRHNPAKILNYCIFIVAASSLATGLIPTNYIDPISCTIVLVSLKFAKEVFSSGLTNILKLLLLTNKLSANKNNEFHYMRTSYYYQISSMIGVFLSALSVYVINNETFKDYWRMLFIIPALLWLITNLLNKNLLQKYSPEDKIPIKKEKIDYKALIKISIIIGYSYFTYYFCFVIIDLLNTNIYGVDSNSLVNSNFIFIAIDIALIILLWRLFKFENYKKIMFFIPFIKISAIIIYFCVINEFSYVTYFIFKLFIIALGVAFSIPLIYWCYNISDKHNIYFTNSLANYLGANIIGKLSIIYLVGLYQYTESTAYIILFISIICFLTSYVIYKSWR